EDQRLTVLALVIESAGQFDFEAGILGGECQGLAKLLFGLAITSQTQQRLGQMASEGQVVRGNPQGVAESLNDLVAHDRIVPLRSWTVPDGQMIVKEREHKLSSSVPGLLLCGCPGTG